MEIVNSSVNNPSSNPRVIVVGLGAHGSSTTYQLAKRGITVTGIDQFHPPHSMGSSHGPSRVMRMAYKEGAGYVPMLRRSFDLWQELNDLYSEPSFHLTGGLFMGQPDGRAISGMHTASKAQNIDISIMTPDEVRRKYPSFNIPDGWEAIWDPKSGAIFPEVAITAHLDLAEKAGAEFRFNEKIEKWSATPSGVTVTTNRKTYEADVLILTSGAWITEMLADLKIPFEIERVTLWMIEPRANRDFFQAGTFPNASFEIFEKYPLYMQANFGTGVKVALDHHGVTTDVKSINRNTTREDYEKIFEQIRRFVPDLDGEVLNSAVCMYTNTPDLNFVVDRHPAHDNVIIGSACSGHGFKFSPVIGEILADLATRETPKFDLKMFNATRFKS